jgi:heat shock protein HslJ
MTKIISTVNIFGQDRSGPVRTPDDRVTGNFELNNDRVPFRQIAATQMACPNPPVFEGPFREALKRANRLTIAGDRLGLFDEVGTRLAAFMAR